MNEICTLMRVVESCFLPVLFPLPCEDTSRAQQSITWKRFLTSILISEVQLPELWERNVLFSLQSMTFCWRSLNWLTQPPPQWWRESTRDSTPAFVSPAPAQGWDPDLLGEGMAMAHWMTWFLWCCERGTYYKSYLWKLLGTCHLGCLQKPPTGSGHLLRICNEPN